MLRFNIPALGFLLLVSMLPMGLSSSGVMLVGLAVRAVRAVRQRQQGALIALHPAAEVLSIDLPADPLPFSLRASSLYRTPCFFALQNPVAPAAVFW